MADPVHVPAAAPASAPVPTATKARPRGGQDAGIRPALFPTQPRATKAARAPRKTTRTAATRPDAAGMDVPVAQAESAEITDAVYHQLIAAVCIPRPVFTSDLVSMVGSSDIVEAWIQRCNSDPDTNPVRFIGAKPRHKARGDLVIPFAPELRESTTEFTSSWWAACIDNANMRGAKLYETAVLLHRFGDQVISNSIDAQATVLTLRLNQPRGLVGVVLLLEQHLGAGEATRARLSDSVGELLSGRLALVAALTPAAGSGPLERLSETLREEAELRGWSTTTPIVAAHSWDFAADGGSSAVQVVG